MYLVGGVEALEMHNIRADEKLLIRHLNLNSFQRLFSVYSSIINNSCMSCNVIW